jgi:hypothetical protein
VLHGLSVNAEPFRDRSIAGNPFQEGSAGELVDARWDLNRVA